MIRSASSCGICLADLKDEERNDMKKLLIIALACFVLTQSQEITVAVTFSVVFFKAIFWVLKKTGLLSAPTRMSNAAGNEVRRAYNRKVFWYEVRRLIWR